MCRIISLVTWNEMRHLRTSIYYYKDGIFVPLSPRQTKNEIHTYINPRSGGNRQRCVKVVG